MAIEILEKEETLEPQSLSIVSQRVQRRWSLGMLSRLIGVPKKHLRQALRILETPKMETEIIEKGEKVRRTFYYGFRKFIIQKRSKPREILAPHPKVQKVFQGIHEWLGQMFTPHENAYGFVEKKNFKEAVEKLLGQKHFFAFDIEDAFPSIEIEMVKNALRRLNVNEVVIDVLAWLVTYYYHGKRSLPQGSPSSPSLLNLVYKPMCEEIDRVCKKYGIIWCVYADDFNFAAQSISQEAKEELKAIPLKYGFKIKEEKIKDNLGRTIPHMLGLTIVKGKIHIRRKRKKECRRRFWEALKYGDYSPAEVKGVAEAIRCIYGEEENWPGWLLRPWREYQAKQTAAVFIRLEKPPLT